MPDTLFDHYFAQGDLELGGYRVQALVQDARAAFARKAVFPFLADVTALAQAMHSVMDTALALRRARPGALSATTFEQGDVQREASPLEVPSEAEAFARWACALLDPLVHEGRTVFRFAGAHVTLEPVGVLPACAREGYLFLEGDGWQAYRFAAYLLGPSLGAELHATPVDDARALTPAALRRALVARFPEMPAPATFSLHSDLDFPTEATLLPVAGRKLPPFLFGSIGLA